MPWGSKGGRNWGERETPGRRVRGGAVGKGKNEKTE